MRKAVYTSKGAPPKGPYSQAIVADGPTVYVSAQGPIDPDTGVLISGSFEEKARQVLENVSVILEEAGSSWGQVIKVNVLLNDMADFPLFNALYESYVSEPYPARTTAQSNIGDIGIFVDCIALMKR